MKKYIKKLEMKRSFSTIKKIFNEKKSIFNNLKYSSNNYKDFIFNKYKGIQAKVNLNPVLFFEKVQDKIENKIKGKSNDVLLKQSIVWAKAITWTLMSGTVFAVGWLCIAKTEEIVIATGKLEPVGGVTEVQFPIQGIASDVFIKEGQEVIKGDLLIKMDTETSEIKRESLENSLSVNENILNRLKELVEAGAVSEIQYLEQKNKVSKIKSSLKENKKLLEYQKIIAPIDGIIFDLKATKPGYVGRSSEPIFKIVPRRNLRAKVEIDSRKIGFVKVGKEVEISIDSYPASDFGVIDGSVTRIGSDALPPDPSLNKGFRFPADIKLNTPYLELKSGQKLPLQVGMSVSTNIKLRKVTYIQLFLNKFQDKAKSLQSI
jgi:hemolysin D